jgi:hypothetical protein
MSEESRVPRNPGAEEDVRSEGDEGRRSAEATPEIADDAAKGQTSVPAPPDDANEAEGMSSEQTKDPHP